MFALPYRGFDFERGLEQALAAMLRNRLRNFSQQRGARIAFGINRVTEAGRQTMVAGKRRKTFVHARARFEFREHRLDSIACTAMDRPRERAQRGQHRGEEIRAGARDHPRRKRGRIQLVLRARNQHAIQRRNFGVAGSRAWRPSEQPRRHPGTSHVFCGRLVCRRMRESERKLADYQLGAIDPGARRLTPIPCGETRHHGREPEQWRRIVTDGGQRRRDRSGHLRAVNLGTQRGDLLGDRTLAAPQQQADLLIRRTLDEFFDRVTAKRELGIIDRADRRLGDDYSGRAVVIAHGLRDGDPARRGRQTATASSALSRNDAAQRLDIRASVERLASHLAAVTLEPAAAHVGIEGTEFHTELAGGLGRSDHAGAIGISSRHTRDHAMREEARQAISIQKYLHQDIRSLYTVNLKPKKEAGAHEIGGSQV